MANTGWGQSHYERWNIGSTLEPAGWSGTFFMVSMPPR
jgi:hypothetical protein